MPGSGKEEFVNAAREEGIDVIRMGDVVREFIKEKGLELTDENIGRTANQEREKHGLGIWAERTISYVSGDLVLIDGIRGDAELDVYKEAFGKNIVVVGIHTSPKIRYERIKKRKRKDATMDWDSFCERDSRELKWGLGNAIAQSDYMIINEGTLEDFKKDAKILLERLVKEGT
jgi:dephospho-CoA kinase